MALPSRGSPPPLPSRVPGGADPRNFSQNASRISTRDVQRATGATYGVWVEFDSTNVLRAKVDPQYDLDGKLTGVGLITVEFLSGATYEYDDRPMSDWFDLIESSSKGRFCYFEVRGPGPSRPGMGIWSHRQISGPTRSAAQVAAMVGNRQPRTREQKRRTYTRGGKRGAYGAGGRRIRPSVG
jgi:hypothetical protein